MALENPTYVGDLVATNPASADPKSQGDDHMRRMKTALLNSFAGFTGAVCVTGGDGGAANAYTLTPAQALPAYGNKMIVVFVPTAYNTAAATLNISGLGAKAIKRIDGTDVLANDLATGTVYSAAYNGTEFRLLSATKNYIDNLAFTTALPAQALGALHSNGTVAAFSATTTGYALNAVKGADIASAATIDLTAATGEYVHVTGTNAITAITIPVGAERVVAFDATLTLTHSASLKLPGSEDISTMAGDKMTVRGDSTGAVVIDYNGGIASAASIKSGASKTKTVTPANMLGALGFSAYAQTGDQVITAGGALTIAHGLGRTPVLFHGFLRCIGLDVAENAGHNTGDVVPVALFSTDLQNPGGVSLTADATNIYIRYANATSSFFITHKSTGASASALNTNWKFFLRVLA